ncbi:MAG TPA: hypothetical protein VHB98_03135, partial [Chloroflexota bacterium]|nr:hypothetical protein [Chloroflexota bacterium]
MAQHSASATTNHRSTAAMLRSILAQHVRNLRFVVVGLAILAYLTVDGLMLAQHETHIHWDMSVNAHGIITWIDPNSPADSANLQAGDQVLPLPGAKTMTAATLDLQPELRIRHKGAVRTVWSSPVFGSSAQGQLLMLIALPLLLIGGLTWAAGGRRKAPAMLGLLSAIIALSLLGDVWGHDGIVWAMYLVEVAAAIGFPLVWAALFLTFPHNRLDERPWRLSLIGLGVLAFAGAVIYLARLFVVLPYLLTTLVAWPVLPFGVLLGLAGLCLRTPAETLQIRQQRRLIGLSAVSAVLPLLLLSFVPEVVQGQPLVPFEMSSFAFLLLPLGFAYAMARYDLMELDVMVRRLAAQALAGLALLTIALVLSVALDTFLPTRAVVVIAVCLVVGARRTIDRGTQALTERLLSPELIQSRALLATLDATTLRGDAELPALVRELEAALQVASHVARCSFLVRRFPGATFAVPYATAKVVSVPALAG